MSCSALAWMLMVDWMGFVSQDGDGHFSRRVWTDMSSRRLYVLSVLLSCEKKNGLCSRAARECSEMG